MNASAYRRSGTALAHDVIRGEHLITDRLLKAMRTPGNSIKTNETLAQCIHTVLTIRAFADRTIAQEGLPR